MIPDRIKGGKGSGIPPKLFDKKELREGTKIEMEHTKDPLLAKEIASDHLGEKIREGKPQTYYKDLKKMEKSAFFSGFMDELCKLSEASPKEPPPKEVRYRTIDNPSKHSTPHKTIRPWDEYIKKTWPVPKNP